MIHYVCTKIIRWNTHYTSSEIFWLCVECNTFKWCICFTVKILHPLIWPCNILALNSQCGPHSALHYLLKYLRPENPGCKYLISRYIFFFDIFSLMAFYVEFLIGYFFLCFIILSYDMQKKRKTEIKNNFRLKYWNYILLGILWFTSAKRNFVKYLKTKLIINPSFEMLCMFEISCNMNISKCVLEGLKFVEFWNTVNVVTHFFSTTVKRTIHRETKL